MIHARFRLALQIICFAWLALWLTGCGDRAAKYVPSLSQAEMAVTAAMEAWKAGVPAGPIPNTKPVVHIVDSQRKPEHVLSDYQILGEVPGNAPRCLAVRLKWSEPVKEERVRYIIVGIDPLWIFRQEDYDLLSHWEHPMDETAKKDAAPSANASADP